MSRLATFAVKATFWIAVTLLLVQDGEGVHAAASISVTVPEPGTLALLAIGLGGLGVETYRRKRKGDDA